MNRTECIYLKYYLKIYEVNKCRSSIQTYFLKTLGRKGFCKITATVFKVVKFSVFLNLMYNWFIYDGTQINVNVFTETTEIQ